MLMLEIAGGNTQIWQELQGTLISGQPLITITLSSSYMYVVDVFESVACVLCSQTKMNAAHVPVCPAPIENDDPLREMTNLRWIDSKWSLLTKVGSVQSFCKFVTFKNRTKMVLHVRVQRFVQFGSI